MVRSGCLKAGELLLGTGDVVHLDTGPVIIISSHHHPVLEVNSTSPAEIEDDKNINKFTVTTKLYNHYNV